MHLGKNIQTAIAVAALVFFSLPSIALSAESILEKSERSLGKKMGNYRLIDQDGNHLPFYSFAGRAVLLNFMYIDCPDMCVLIGYSLSNYLEKMDKKFKGKIIVLSVSIDPDNDTPAKMNEYGHHFTDSFDNWRFTTTDKETVALMVKDLGFSYEVQADGIEHLNRVSLISPDGVVIKHFYGTDFDVKEMDKAVGDVFKGNPLANAFSAGLTKLALYCSTYNQATKKYGIDYTYLAALFVQLLIMVATIVFLLREKLARLLGYVMKKLGMKNG